MPTYGPAVVISIKFEAKNDNLYPYGVDKIPATHFRLKSLGRWYPKCVFLCANAFTYCDVIFVFILSSISFCFRTKYMYYQIGTASTDERCIYLSYLVYGPASFVSGHVTSHLIWFTMKTNKIMWHRKKYFKQKVSYEMRFIRSNNISDVNRNYSEERERERSFLNCQVEAKEKERKVFFFFFFFTYQENVCYRVYGSSTTSFPF